MEYLLRDLRHCPRYSRQELIDLGRQYRDHGDLQAREQMILGIVPLAVRQARRYHPQGRDYGLTMGELVSEALMGVVRAVDKFNPSRGVALTTYASYWINQFLRRALHNCSVIHVPEYAHKRLGNTVLPELQDHVDRAYRISSLSDRYINQDGDKQMCLADAVPDYRLQNESLMSREFGEQRRQQAEVRRAVSQIADDRIRGILLGRLCGVTLAALGRRYRVTRERIRQLELTGHEQLREILLSQEPLEEIEAA